MGDLQTPGSIAGPWAFGVITALSIAATGFTLGGDTARTLRDQSIEADLLNEGVTADWIEFCRQSIRTSNGADPSETAKALLLKALRVEFPKADTTQLNVSGVLVCPTPDPSGKLAEALALDRGITASYGVVPNSRLIFWLGGVAASAHRQVAASSDQNSVVASTPVVGGNAQPDEIAASSNGGSAGQSDEGAPPSAATSPETPDSPPSEAMTVAKALDRGARVDSIAAFQGDPNGNFFTGDGPDADAVARQGPEQDPKHYYVEIEYHDPDEPPPADGSSSTPPDDNAVVRLSDQDGIFAFDPPTVIAINDFYYRKRAHQDPHYSRVEGGNDGSWFNFPALAEREDVLRDKRVADVALQLHRELSDRSDKISAFGIDFSLLQFALFDFIGATISLAVFARSIALAGTGALPPVIRDMPRVVMGLIVVAIVALWPSVILLAFRFQFRFAYPQSKGGLQIAAGVWAIVTSLALLIAVSANRRAALR